MTNPAHQPPPTVADLQKRVETLEQQCQWLKDENARIREELRTLKGN
jgi:chaperonin cofactor prefoldin